MAEEKKSEPKVETDTSAAIEKAEAITRYDNTTDLGSDEVPDPLLQKIIEQIDEARKAGKPSPWARKDNKWSDTDITDIQSKSRGK